MEQSFPKDHYTINVPNFGYSNEVLCYNLCKVYGIIMGVVGCGVWLVQGSTVMMLIVMVIKYIFVIALGVEALLIIWALIGLARDKARLDRQPTPAKE